MGNLEELRNRMVRDQLVARGISDPRVLEAMRAVPRERLMPENEIYMAYEDSPFPIGQGQTISQPYMVAYMTELLGLKGHEKVLEIGTGSGYHAAVLSLLAKEVYTIERIPELADSATAALSEQGYGNVTVITADGAKGLPKHAPFDAILVNASSKKAPQALLDQLGEDGGRLVMPLGSTEIQILTLFTRHGWHIDKRETIPCRYVPLI